MRKNWLLLVISMLLPTFGVSYSALTAQRIYASYSALQRSISVSTLEKFADTGNVSDDLAVYAQFLKTEQLQELRRVLINPIKVHPVAVSQFLYTQQGEFLLQRLGEVIKTDSREQKPGFHALRSALILAAKEPQGLTLLNIFRKYPSASIHIDLARTLSIAAELERLVTETDRAIATVKQKSNSEAIDIAASLSLAQLPDIRRQGSFAVRKQTLKFLDRGRLLMTDIYLPNTRTPAPVIVISHGIGSDSSNYAYLANHLASHGLGVVVPNHPGSDTKQLRSLLNGSESELAQAEEFYHRPMDVKYILDKIEADPQYKGRLNVQTVGVFGQSFGGYTALALAGAKINFTQLQKDCNPKALKETWNVSLLLQCRAAELQTRNPNREYSFRDTRVKAVIAVNPVTSSIFGQEGLSEINVPVMMMASSDDTVAPALYEQIRPFSWIQSTNKYLVLLTGATHFSVIGNGKTNAGQIGLPSEVVGDDPKQARKYVNTISLPFFQTHVAGVSQYSPFLNAAYAQSISTQPMGMSMIQSLNSNDLARAIAQNSTWKPMNK